MRIAIIGAGIVGSAIAWHAARRGLDVTVIDQGEPGRATSAKSFGWINATAAANRSYFDLRRAAMAEWKRLDKELEGRLPLAWPGSLAFDQPQAELAAEASRLNGYGHDLRLIGADEFARLEPKVAARPPACMAAPGDGVLEADEASRVLLGDASGRGARLLAGVRVEAVTPAGDGPIGVNTDCGVMSFDKVVIAAGLGAPALAQAAGFNLPMDNRPGVLVRTRPVQRLVDHVVMAPGAHFRQLDDGAIVAGEDFGGGGDSDLEAVTSRLVARLEALLPAAGGLAVARVSVALRPMPADGLPAVGAVDRAGRIHLAVMHSGVTLAALIARLVAGEVTDGEAAAMLEPFRPQRFARAETGG